MAAAESSVAREQLLHDANHLEGSGGQFSAELLKLRDELDGELLGNRFEELDVKAAARLEALLGPLTQAIVVDNVAEATERLRGKPRELSELRLVAAGTDLELLNQQANENAGDLYVNEGPALRVTRRPRRGSGARPDVTPREGRRSSRSTRASAGRSRCVDKRRSSGVSTRRTPSIASRTCPSTRSSAVRSSGCPIARTRCAESA